MRDDVKIFRANALNVPISPRGFACIYWQKRTKKRTDQRGMWKMCQRRWYYSVERAQVRLCGTCPFCSIRCRNLQHWNQPASCMEVCVMNEAFETMRGRNTTQTKTRKTWIKTCCACKVPDRFGLYCAGLNKPLHCQLCCLQACHTELEFFFPSGPTWRENSL
jgi:hypothetical protein